MSRQRASLLAAVVVFMGGIAASARAAATGGLDFASLYAMGRAVVTGTNVYAPSVAATFPEKYGVMVPAGMFYPPATGFAMLPFALFPFQVGKVIWFVTLTVVLTWGIRRLVRGLAPNAPSHVWILVAGTIFASSALRWAMLLLQGAPLVLGLLCWFVAALHGGQRGLSTWLAAIAVAAKMTLALPFIGLLLLQRRFKAVLISGASWVVLNVLGFLRMGGGAFRDYQLSVDKLEAFGDINSPDPWNALSNPRLDWKSLFYGLSGSLPIARIGTLACATLIALWLVREGFKETQPTSLRSTALFLPPLVCLGSLCVYHHHYDAALFFAPVLVLLAVFGPRQLPVGAWLLLPLMLMMLIMPVGIVQTVAGSCCGERGIGWVKLAFPIATSCAMLGSLLVLHARDRTTKAADS